MAFFAGDDGIEKTVAVEVAERGVLGEAGFEAFGEREAEPVVGVFRTEGYTDVIAVFVDGNDVEVAVVVEVAHRQAVGAAQRYAAGSAPRHR